EADELADRIGVLDDGRLVAEGTPAELKRQVPGGRVEVSYADLRRLTAAAESLEQATVDEETLTLSLPHDGSLAALEQLIGRLDSDAVTGVDVRTPDLDDVFLLLTGHTTTPAEPLEGRDEPARIDRETA
ncbi:MAG: DUF4162 domain-containing protein, partial [Tomitella sp.]|nr:DUF4162 domain-containing protein [Tomitella sp.]